MSGAKAKIKKKKIKFLEKVLLPSCRAELIPDTEALLPEISGQSWFLILLPTTLSCKKDSRGMTCFQGGYDAIFSRFMLSKASWVPTA